MILVSYSFMGSRPTRMALCFGNDKYSGHKTHTHKILQHNYQQTQPAAIDKVPHYKHKIIILYPSKGKSYTTAAKTLIFQSTGEKTFKWKNIISKA